jgi:formiminotetrahydrofolate cyclodeaminase
MTEHKNLVERTLGEFAQLLASEAPTPGGGSAAALAAALGTSLCAMVARLTVGREKYHDSRESMGMMREAADDLSARFLALVDRDSDAYNHVLAALGLPKETEAQKESRGKAMERAMRKAAAAPMETLEELSRVPGLLREALLYGNPNCLTDAGVAVQLVRAAATGAAYNVRINLAGIKDQAFTGTLSVRARELLAQILSETAELEQIVEQRLGF